MKICIISGSFSHGAIVLPPSLTVTRQVTLSFCFVMEPRSNPRIVVVLASSFFFLGLLAFFAGMGGGRGTSIVSMWLGLNKGTTNIALPTIPHRRLLNGGRGRSEPNRIWGEKCSKSDIVISQGPTGPLPSGIPSYTVEIINMCAGGCDISGIHLACGWFSSARLINPKVFKRLRYNDCLVNDGKPLRNGVSVSFQYANTFLYPLSVASVVCT